MLVQLAHIKFVEMIINDDFTMALPFIFLAKNGTATLNDHPPTATVSFLILLIRQKHMPQLHHLLDFSQSSILLLPTFVFRHKGVPKRWEIEEWLSYHLLPPATVTNFFIRWLIHQLLLFPSFPPRGWWVFRENQRCWHPPSSHRSSCCQWCV